MKKLLSALTVCLFLTSGAFASTWEDDWTSAVQCCVEKDYSGAESHFDKCIQTLESEKDDSHPHVYVDRARLYSLLDRHEEALHDLNKAIPNKKLNQNDRHRALVTRISAHLNLQMEDEALEDYYEFKNTNPNFPKIEFTKTKVIIRNVPDCDCYKMMAKAFLVSSQICEKEEDIQILDSGMIIAKRKPCDCGCDKAQKMQMPKALMKAAGKPQKPAPTQEEQVQNCKYWCDKSALAGTAWCMKVFKKWHCQTGCVFAVDLIKDGCYWCCKDGNFYQRCIKPFEDILSRMATPCDPAWD